MDNDTSLAYEKPFPMMSFYNMTKFIMKWSMHQFFRHIIILGQKNVPKRGPVVFCGNHANQFVDGSIVFFATPRDTRFMVAAKVSHFSLFNIRQFNDAIVIFRFFQNLITIRKILNQFNFIVIQKTNTWFIFQMVTFCTG